jgi:hypothetical protein
MVEYKIDSYLENIDKNAIEGEISTHKRVVSFISIKDKKSEIRVHRDKIMRIAKEIEELEKITEQAEYYFLPF